MFVGERMSCGAFRPLIDAGPNRPATVGGSARLQPTTAATIAPAKSVLIRMPVQETENVPLTGRALDLVGSNWRLPSRIVLSVTATTRAMVLADGTSRLFDS